MTFVMYADSARGSVMQVMRLPLQTILKQKTLQYTPQIFANFRWLRATFDFFCSNQLICVCHCQSLRLFNRSRTHEQMDGQTTKLNQPKDIICHTVKPHHCQLLKNTAYWYSAKSFSTVKLPKLADDTTERKGVLISSNSEIRRHWWWMGRRT